MDIAAWLRGLRLSQYEQAFRDNAVDAEILPKLTGDDLREMGVVAIGHRRKLLEAIEALHDGLRPRQADVNATEPSVAHLPEPPVSRAERRQLTVMFVDLVGSTALSSRLDPEEMSELTRSYQNAVAGEIGLFEGHVAKFMGDGVLAYFGWPRAHEDEAERAVRAALAVVQAVARLGTPAGEPLAARVGIATGLVVVGDLIGQGSAQEQAVSGETPNLAARLQALAPPSGVVVAPSTRRLIGSGFELEALGPFDLKGFAAPVPAWRVLAERTIESRFEARGAGLVPLVGREEEIGLLLRRWQLAEDGDGQAVLVSGEPGIGKSRLTRSLYQHLERGPAGAAAPPHVQLRHQCSPYHVNSALHPTIEYFVRTAGFERDDRPAVKLDRLEALLAQGSGIEGETVPLIAALLLLPIEGRYPPLSLAPQRQKERTIEVLVDHVVGLSRRQPVLCVFEDVHWADPTTLELLDQLIGRMATERVLLLLTFRPEFVPRWIGRPHVTLISLNRLARRQSAALVGKVAGGKALPPEVLEQIVAKTDGVPLFVEELTKTVLEAGLLRERGDRYELAGPLPPLAIPATLQDSLMARLDRLASVKEVAQTGAVIGRSFPHELLAAVSPLDPDRLAGALDQLVAAELVFRQGVAPHATYLFKHALVQEAAYASLLRTRRQQLHARIAEVLQERFPDSVANQPELLAHHFTEAGLAEQAIRYWRRAGERASERSANLEAIAHLRQALKLVEAMPDAPGRVEKAFALQLAIAGLLVATKGQGAPDVEHAYLRAGELCEQLGRSAELFPAIRGLWNCYFTRGELQKAQGFAERALALAETEGEPVRRALACRALGSTLFFSGRFEEAWERLRQGIALADAAAHAGDRRADLLLYVDQPGIICRLYAAWSEWLLGHPDRAAATMDQALALGRELSNAHNLAFALGFAAVLHCWRQEFEVACQLSDAAIDVAREHGLPLLLSLGTMSQGVALAGLGRHAEGIAELRAGFAEFTRVGSRGQGTMWLGLTAEAHAAAGQLDPAFAALDQASAMATGSEELFYQAELYRLRGAFHSRQREAPEAERWFDQAIDLARRQGARSLELRAATDLARLRRDEGRRAEARNILAPLYGSFSEGLDTPDLREARTVLDTLS